MRRKIISTTAAPAAIGIYSQAVQAGDTLYLSGQIGLDPASMQMVEGIDGQIVRVFENLKAVAAAAGKVSVAYCVKACAINACQRGTAARMLEPFFCIGLLLLLPAQTPATRSGV